jgi:hypothetical protein
MKKPRADQERVARIRDLRDRLLPDQADNSLGKTASDALLALGDLVTAFLAAEDLHLGTPCLHRYRGIVRDREVARRARLYREAREALKRAVLEGLR